ncbi:MAG: fimbrillin family protein [Prevotella sp.]
MRKLKLHIGITLSLFGLASCSNDDSPETPKSAKETPITVVAMHPSATRVTATDFEEGDRIGLYVAEETEELELSGNLVNNEPMTLVSNTWAGRRTLYWDEGRYNAYAYYPYQSILSIEDQPFGVATDQTTTETADQLGGYEASDLLFAMTAGVEARQEPVALRFKHIMSRLTVRLVKGEDFEGDMPRDAEVFIHNTVTTATIDLSAGIATREVNGTRHTIKARQEDDNIFGAIVVPQRIDNRMPLIEVVMKGVSYLYESKFVFKTGVNHLVNLVITSNPEQAMIEIGGEIENWQ